MTVTLCLSCSLGLLNWRPRAHSAGCWLSLLHLISIFSGSQTPSGFPMAPSVGCGFPYHISSPTVWNSTGNSTGPLGVELNRNRNSILLYNHSTPTRSPKSNTQSPSSGNNCHSAQRPASSGASLYECTMGTSLAHPTPPANPRPCNPPTTAIRMCHPPLRRITRMASPARSKGQNTTKLVLKSYKIPYIK